MVEFTKIEIENAGPYRGLHEISFSSPTGVWIAYGSNGRGKTSLLNALRYVLYGEILGRLGPIAPPEWINKPAREAGEANGFRVTLEFRLNEGERWEVTRSYDTTRTPPEVLIVSKDEDSLAAEAGAEALAAIAPPELSGFFLFDAEDLRKYELLLDQDGEAVEKLRSAIERILGIPYLHRAAAALSTVNGEATTLVAEHLKRNNATRAAGAALEEAQGLKAELVAEVAKERDSLAQIDERIGQVMDDLRRHSRSQRIVAQLDAAREQKGKAIEQVSEAKANLQVVNPKLWRAVLLETVRKRLEATDAEIEPLQAAADKAAASKHLIRSLEDADGECPLCRHGIDELERESIRDTLAAGSISLEDERRLALLRGQVGVLRKAALFAETDVLIERERRLDEKRVDLREVEDRMERLEDELDAVGVDEADIHSKNRERDQLLIQENKLRDRIDDLEQRVQEQEASIASLRAKALNAPTPLDPTVRALESLSGRLKNLFDSTADAYREGMRREVEQKATEIFLEIRTEDEYAGLQINDGYGLTILDQSGDAVPHRSAGYEHLVALALLGALQSFSPNRGPVIIDTPFGRLDPQNTERVMAALPRIANQTLLLTFEGEFDRESAVRALQQSLIEEFDLRKISSQETEIVKR